MHVACYVPLLLPVFAVPGLRLLSRWLPPRLATWVVTLAAVILALASGIALLVLVVAGLAQLPVFAVWGRWSVPAIARAGFVPLPVGFAAATGLIIAGGCVFVSAARCVRALRAAYAQVRGARSALVVLDRGEPLAYAVPGGCGHIVVSTAMLRALDGIGRRALLAHERAHLTGRHHLFAAVVRISVAINPLLGGLRATVGYTLERWADETAAQAVGSRTLTARAIATAALISRAPRDFALAATAGPVPLRVAALLGDHSVPGARQPRRPLSLFAAASVTALLLATLGFSMDAASDLHETLEAARCMVDHQIPLRCQHSTAHDWIG